MSEGILLHSVLAVLSSIVLVSAFSIPSFESFHLKASTNLHFAASTSNLHSVANGRCRMFSLPKLRMCAKPSYEDLTALLKVKYAALRKLRENDEALGEALNPLIRLNLVLDANEAETQEVSEIDTDSYTICAVSRKPAAVKRWGVREEVIKHRLSLSQAILGQQIRKLAVTTPQLVTAESVLQSEFFRVVGGALGDITKAAGVPMTLHLPTSIRMGREGSANKPDRSAPDFLLVEVQQEPTKASNSNRLKARRAAKNGKIPVLPTAGRAVGEIKCGKLCLGKYEADLVARYDGQQNLLTCALEQLTGYMVEYKSEYGFLTTFDWLWLARIDQEHNLYISEGFSADTKGPGSLLNAMNYLCHLVSQGKKFQPPQFDSGFRKKTLVGNTANQTGAEKGADPHAVEPKEDKDNTVPTSSLFNTTVEVVAEFDEYHKDRFCFVGRRDGEEDGELFVIKGFSDKWMRDRELKLYQLLQDLQGRGIPRVTNSSVVLHDHPDRQHGLVLEWSGNDLVAMDKPPAASVMSQLPEIVRKMHCLGVVHGDIATRNVAWRQETDQISVLDLGEAKTAEELGPAEFADMCRADMTAVEEVLAVIQEDADTWTDVAEMLVRV